MVSYFAERRVPPQPILARCFFLIKLIAADLDGTLLDSRRQLSPGLFPLLKELRARGIRFTPASGRQYHNLARLFPPDGLLFIADNGAMLADGGRVTFVDEIPPADLAQPLSIARATPGVYPIFSGARTAYYEDADDPVFLENARMYYEKLEYVDDLMEAAQRDRICKIALFEQGRAEEDCYPRMQPCAGRFLISLSGRDWVDMMNPGVNKGAALRRLQQQLGVSPDECMAFGDYLNDLELMQAVTHSYAMANAHPALKAACRYEAPSNDEDGVVRAIRQALGL